jgi:hypothetical protein
VAGALFKKVVTTALFCKPNKRSPDEPSETEVNVEITKAIFIYQAMTLTKDSVLWNGLPQSGNIASTFSEKIQNPLNLSLDLHLSNMSVITMPAPVQAYMQSSTVLMRSS